MSPRSFEWRLVAFVDVLGSQERAADPAFMSAIVETADIQTRLAGSWPSGRRLGFRSTWFSDNLGASLPLDPAADLETRRYSAALLLRIVAGVQARLLCEYGHLSRGGVALDDCYHSDGHIFGPALVEAYRLEWAADSPRVVLADEVRVLAEGGPIPLLPDEPLRQKDGWELPSEAVAIDFMRAELPGSADRPAYLATLERQISDGLVAAKTAARPKWDWARRHLALLDGTATGDPPWRP